jgi:AcrR family transcriptional regulator
MATRSYLSPARDAAAAATQAKVVEAAARLLREPGAAAGFSLDAVAKAAGVTRLTVYNKFGSRRGLLEAVFDQRAQEGGLARIPEAMKMPDPRAALARIVTIFCEFWAHDPAVGSLHDAASADPEFRLALTERNELRRTLLRALVKRCLAPAQHRRRGDDAVDLLFALTSHAMYRSLEQGRSGAQVCALLLPLCEKALGAED